MITLFIFQFLVFLGAFLIANFITFNSQRGNLGKRLRNFCYSESLGEYFVLVIMISGLIMMLINLLFFTIFNFMADSGLVQGIFILDNNNVNININTTANVQNPSRWWPTGVAQTWSVVGVALAAYRLTPGSTRARTTAALGALTVAIPTNVLSMAVENPDGFSRLVYSWTEFLATGRWPPDFPTSAGNSAFTNTRRSFLPIPEGFLSFISNILTNGLMKYVINIFRPVAVEGHLDDLIGQQLFIHFLLLIMVIGLIILCSLYFFITIMISNKDFILKRFNNRFILFYIKYQVFLARLSQFYFPILILFGLIHLLLGLHFLITHPIPYEKLPIDLHTYIKK